MLSLWSNTLKPRGDIAKQKQNMCLYPRFIKNKRYFATLKMKKRGYTEQICEDERKLYVPIGCGKCIECLKQKANEWKVRLIEELKYDNTARYVTLTFTNESLKELAKITQEKDDNTIATIAVRRFLERWRKKYKKSVKHWLITELGHENTERIHLHGIIFCKEEQLNELANLWKYGNIRVGEYCNLITINYIMKYVTKIDLDHKGYTGRIMCSAGLGLQYCKEDWTKNKYKYKKNDTPEDYTLPNGRKVALPIYMRNKFYNQEDRDKIWTDRLDRHEIYVRGIKVNNLNTQKGYNEYLDLLKTQQMINENLGYGNTDEEWKKKKYYNTLKMLNNTGK